MPRVSGGRRKAIVAGALALAVSTTWTARAAEPELTRMKIGMTGSSSSVSAFYASDHELFRKHGLDASIQIVKEGSTAVSGLVSGDFQLAGPTGTVFLQAVDSGLDLVAVAPQFVFPTPTALGVLARTGSGVSTARDLVGKRIGVPGRGGLQDILAHDWLDRNKVSPDRVTFVELAFAQMADALRAGQVEAVTANDPVYNRIIDQHLASSIIDLRTLVPPGSVGGVYAASRDWAAQHAGALRDFRAALQDAVDAIASDPAGAKASIAHFTKLPPYVMATTEIPTLSASLRPEQLTFWIDLMQKQGILGRRIDAAQIIAP
jgi:NitT/TauT family transport system substrate-binding protein